MVKENKYSEVAHRFLNREQAPGTSVSPATKRKLLLIKSIHTLVWLGFNVVLIYLYYAVLTRQIGKWVWMGLGLFVMEGLVLLMFHQSCPLTVWARRYDSSARANFDIFLPEWLARNNKRVYLTALVVLILILVFQLLNPQTILYS